MQKSLKRHEFKRSGFTYKLRLPLFPIAINEAVAFRWVRRHALLNLAARDLAAECVFELISANRLAAADADGKQYAVVLFVFKAVTEDEAKDTPELYDQIDHASRMKVSISA